MATQAWKDGSLRQETVVKHIGFKKLSSQEWKNQGVIDDDMIALPRYGAKYCDERICMSVCPGAYLKNQIAKLH